MAKVDKFAEGERDMIGDKITVKDTDGKYYEREILNMWTGSGKYPFEPKVEIAPLPSGKSVLTSEDEIK